MLVPHLAIRTTPVEHKTLLESTSHLQHLAQPQPRVLELAQVAPAILCILASGHQHLRLDPPIHHQAAVVAAAIARLAQAVL